jgi:proliferating cell nuclear antigen
MTDLINKYSIDTNIVTIKTVQINPFKTTFTCIKDILVDTNMVITPQGIKIVSMDKSHTVLVHLFLEAEKFEFYECKKSKIIIGINMLNFFKLIALLENNDTLTIYIQNNDYLDGIVTYLSLKYDNIELNQTRYLKLRLMEPDAEEYEYPDVTFTSIINIPSSRFQRIIKDTLTLTNKIEIQSVANELIFKWMGDFSIGELHLGESQDGIKFVKQQDPSIFIQGEFSLKNLNYFIKCTSLCDIIEIYLENDLPLVVKYDVARLGEIKLCLSPHP